MRTKVKLKELVGSEAHYVSLVNRAANQMPFRIVKAHKENDMLDLSNPKTVFGAVKKSAKSPVTVSAIVALKGSDAQFAAIKKAVADHGFKVDQVKELVDGDDVSVMFMQDDSPEEGGKVIRMSDSTLIIAKGFSPYSTELEAAGFDDMVKTTGFNQGVYTACAAVQNALATKLHGAADQETAVKSVGDTLKQFTSYVTSLVAGLPANAFKMDKAVTDAVAAVAKTDADAKTVADKAAADAAAAAVVAKAAKVQKMSKGDWDKMDAEAKKKYLADNKMTDEEDAYDGGSDEDTEDAKKSTETLVAQLAPVTSALEAITKTLGELSASNKTLGETVAKLQDKVDGTERTIKGTILAPAMRGEQPAGVQKAAAVQEFQHIDTAMESRSKKYASL